MTDTETYRSLRLPSFREKPRTMLTTPLAPEIIWFTPSESYLAQPADTLTAVSKSAADDGLLGAYYGFEEQNPSTAVWIMAWKNLAAHQNFMEHEKYVDFALPIMESMVGLGEFTQILLSKQSGFLKAVSSPVTQFVYLKLRPRHNLSYELLPIIERAVEELHSVPGYLGSSFGPSIEHQNLYVGVLGWRSIADRDHAVAGMLAPIISLIRELATIEMRFVRLNLFRPD